MRKEIFEVIKNEALYIGLLFLLGLVIFKIAFFKESFIVVVRNVLSLFWLFALPGYCIMLYWNDKLGFVERLLIGIFVSAAITGVFSYYFGLLGLNIKYHYLLFPLIIMPLGIIFFLSKNK